MRRGEDGGGQRERFERRVSPSARCFVRMRGAGGKEEGRKGQCASDKNSPNPSLITMPAKSEILTAVAPRRAAPSRREERRAEGERDRERTRSTPKKLDSFLHGQKQRRRASALREVSDKERAPLTPCFSPRNPPASPVTPTIFLVHRRPSMFRGAPKPPPFTLRLYV